MNGEAPLLKTTLTYLIEHGDVDLVFNYSLYPKDLVFVVLEGTLHTTRGERYTNLAIKPEICNNNLPTWMVK